MTLGKSRNEGSIVTIAACFIQPGAVVFGADSTTTTQVSDLTGANKTTRHFQYAQKIFEIGEGSTLGAVTWGLGAFDDVSYRELFAQLGDDMQSSSPSEVEAVALRFIDLFWGKYDGAGSIIQKVRARIAEIESASDPSPEERAEAHGLRIDSHAGFCIGGRVEPSRSVAAYQILFQCDQPKPTPTALPSGGCSFWGVPNIINRVIHGIDPALGDQIVNSGMWQGTRGDLANLCKPYGLAMPSFLPVREMIDFVHSIISLTSRGLKFSHWAPVCGGPVETATVTADRRFRWVTHKTLDEAIRS